MKRRIRFLLCIVASLLLASFAFGDDEPKLPEPVKDGDAGFVSGKLIFELDGRPTPECHASTIVETPSGLIAAWFAGKHEKNPDVGIWISRHTDGSWSKPEQIFDGSEDEKRDYACWNPVLFQPKDGPLLLFYKVGPSPSTWWGVLSKSTDDGKTWSRPKRLGRSEKLGEPNTNLLGPVKNKPIQLPDGSILCASSSEHNKWRVHFELTRDLGDTWEVIGPIHDGKKFNAIQPSLLTYDSGLQILCRTKEKVIGSSWSRDGGKTWSSFEPINLPNPNAGTDAVTLHDGRRLLVYNHSTRNFRSNGRQILNVAVSTDGKTWKPVMTLEKEPNKDGYSYPAVIQSKDGKVHITYTYRRQSVKHVVLDPMKLK